jgi:cell division protein FtsW
MDWLPRTRYGLDGVFCAAVAALLGWGLIMVASASVAVGEKLSGNPLFFFERQMVFAGLGLAAGIAVFAIPMATWEKFGPVLLMFALALLIVVLIPGIGLRINSSRRWLDFAVFRLQASEPARLAVIVYLAGYIVRRQARLQTSLMGLAAPFMPLGLAGLLLLAEPDFGATAILFAVAMVMLFIGGARLPYLGGIFGVSATLLGLIAIAAPYRVKRLLGFIDPWADANNSGWQLTQSLIAVGRGEWFGVGLGNSVQKLLYLPEMHTDFIFAILAEEFGLVGVIVLIALFGLVVWRGFAIGGEAERQGARFPAYLCYGLSSWLGLQAAINMAVNMGMLPTKGLTLPFISYGGSSLLTVCVMVALILRVDHENRLARAGHPAANRRDYAPRVAGARA